MHQSLYTLQKSGTPGNNYHNALVFSPTNDLLAVETDIGIQIWDAKTGQEKEGPKFSEQSSNFRYHGAAAFSQDGGLLAYVNENGDFSIWDMTRKEIVSTITGHASFINAIAFSPDNCMIVSASDDGTVRIWGIKP
jgi:WD40 repeat protein